MFLQLINNFLKIYLQNFDFISPETIWNKFDIWYANIGKCLIYKLTICSYMYYRTCGNVNHVNQSCLYRIHVIMKGKTQPILSTATLEMWCVMWRNLTTIWYCDLFKLWSVRILPLMKSHLQQWKSPTTATSGSDYSMLSWCLNTACF